jgi:hypothetical protein
MIRNAETGKNRDLHSIQNHCKDESHSKFTGDDGKG